jgi:pimeloyl-ACP methyl ester carboxylesterase
MEVLHQYHEIKGSNGRPIPIDIHFIDRPKAMPIAIFAHGYKGFKDFGAWSLIGDEMAKSGIVFVRFNFSHNGVTLTEPKEFNDLEAFGENNYSKEVDDFSKVIDFISELAKKHSNWNRDKICIIGHSRGGGMAILTAAENKKVRALITWAAIKSTFERMPKGKALKEWKEKGVRYVLNGRTKQQMPHYFQFYKDLEKNKERLNIEAKAMALKIPWLIIHGDHDEAVALEDAQILHRFNADSQLRIIKNGTHTFSISHPWNEPELSKEMQDVVDLSLQFIQKI